MAGKLLLVLAAVVVVVAASAQACLEKYIAKPATGKEGLYECCYEKLSLQDAAQRYEGEEVMLDLREDFTRVNKSIDEQKGDCDKFRVCSKIGEIRTWRDYTGKKWDDLQCNRWTKFDRLCKLMKAKKSDDQQKLAIENWVCQVAKESVMDLNDLTRNFYGNQHECTTVIRQKATNEANKEFEKISCLTAEQLELARQALAEQVASEKASKAVHDAQVTEEASKMLMSRIVNNLDKFKKCAAKRETDLVEHAKEIAELNERMEQMRGNYMRKHRGF